jgi:hypothetical protein
MESLSCCLEWSLPQSRRRHACGAAIRCRRGLARRGSGGASRDSGPVDQGVPRQLYCTLAVPNNSKLRNIDTCVLGDAQDGSLPPKNVLNISPATDTLSLKR